jgi:hypothetical protein
MNLDHFMNLALGAIGFFAVTVLNDIRKSIDETKKSVDELNLKVAIVIEKTANHERQLEMHTGEIRELQLYHASGK